MPNFCYLNPNTDIKPSPIHGLCRFATADINKDDIVFVIGGIAKKPSESGWYKGLMIDQDLVLDLPDGSEYEAFVNHSCEPNVYIDGQIVFRALRDIKTGEYITVDYGTFMLTNNPYIKDCNCGSSKCRKQITGEDYKFLTLPLSWYAQKRKRQ